MSSGVRNIVIAQVILAAGVVVAYALWRGRPEAVAALFGSAIVLGNSFLLARRVRRAGELDASRVATAMYAGVAERMVLTLAAFGLGMGVLKLEPLPQIVAFAIGQLGFVIAAQRQHP